MRTLRPKRRWILLTSLVLSGIGVGVAIATVTPTVLADTTSVHLRIVHSEFVPSADQPSFTSGWHMHPGPVFVQVQEGELKITQATCHPNVVHAGETYVETPDLPVLAKADKPVKWTMSMILPAGAPLSIPVSESPC